MKKIKLPITVISCFATFFVVIATLSTSMSSLLFWGETPCPESLKKS